MVALGACSNEELMPDVKPDAKPQTGRTLSLTASMPKSPTTRVGLTQEADKTITLTWQAGDELQLAFVQGTNKAKTVATVKNISEDKKQATFDIEIPPEFDANTFDLYGVYGGGGLSDANPTQLQLPSNPGNTTSLNGIESTSVQNRKDVLLYFESKNIGTDNPQATATFQHLGSLFSFTLQNNGDTAIDDIKEVRLRSHDITNKWGYNTGDGNQVYDFVDGFQNKEAGSDYYIYFDAASKSIAAGEPVTLWAWYPPLPDVIWPALKIELIKTNNSRVVSANTLPARDTPTAAGKSYYFYAAWDGTELNFTDDLFSNELTIHVAEMGTLSTLLSATQKSIVKKLTVTGQINELDYAVMKKQMPSLRYVDLSQVASYEGETPNKIPDSAFGDFNGYNANSAITTIVLPESITAIGGHAFRNCYSLTGSLTIPENVTEIGNFAFSMCEFTGDLVLPNGLTTIQLGAFNKSKFNGSLIIPTSVIIIGESAFSDCQFTGDLILPEGLTTIENAAFNRCENITGTVVFPSKLTSIGTFGFNKCTGIDAFQFPHTTPIAYTENMLPSGKPVEVQALAVATYQGADGWNTHPIALMFDEYAINVATKGTMSTLLTPLQKANIRKLTVTGQINKADYDVMKSQMPNLRVVDLGQVTSYEGETANKIPYEAFMTNKTITTIILPESTTAIGDSAFRECSGLTGDLILPAALKTIGRKAFYNCAGITGSLVIPDNVITIGESAFAHCIGFNDSLVLPVAL